MKWLAKFSLLLAALFSAALPLWCSAGGTISVTKAEWEQITTLSKRLQTESQTLNRQLELSRAELKPLRERLEKSETQAQLLQTSYDALKRENASLERRYGLLRFGGLVSVGVAAGAVVYIFLKN